MPPAGFWRSFLAIVFAIAIGASAWAQPVQPVPALAARVIDQTGTLDASQRAALEAKLAALEKAKGSQVVVLMVPTTAPEDIASYANRVGNTWKIGRKDVGDGVLLVVAKDDRKLRIEVAKTLDRAWTAQHCWNPGALKQPRFRRIRRRAHAIIAGECA